MNRAIFIATQSQGRPSCRNPVTAIWAVGNQIPEAFQARMTATIFVRLEWGNLSNQPGN
jgi:hypothetical protein